MTLEVACECLADPVSTGKRLSADVSAELARMGTDLNALREQAWKDAYVHLPNAFDAADLPETPEGFLPLPHSEGTLLARASSIAAIAALGLDTVSYGSENDGELFVNLVIIPGEGDFSVKSRKSMQGHTDAVSFPVRGRFDSEEVRIAPSPDFVCLSGLRNPTNAETTVMPLSQILPQLTAGQIAELKKPQFIIRAQKTFREGTQRILGEEHVVDGGEFLFDVNGQLWVRYSHSSAGADDEGAAADAVAAFEAACKTCAIGIVIAPGDILLVNNRIGLHGRTSIDGEAGGESRWLLRTYGLDTAGLDPQQRYEDSVHKLFP
ncbi:TauD/TfdA family dioxygenase [Burkholderia cepacia]|uniref:TauD/TfdA family dioxygenase n=1 Tax=Burkholderia cepacia TaxID=292 RepID=UPI0007567DB1|nr:TauD/TfdA family dioxygenase [Burkholderia cepacia]KVA43518.1 taurine catabolism dioxygenase TauD [Burkholderia cepacia]KVC34202.1 taurine catabolism dioxygenase TauD [Burkholderia cepacia]